MVTTSKSPDLCCFTVQYVESKSLCRILDVLMRAGAEPAWLFTRVQRNRFQLETHVCGMCETKATTLAARIKAIVNVLKVDWKFMGQGQRHLPKKDDGVRG